MFKPGSLLPEDLKLQEYLALLDTHQRATGIELGDWRNGEIELVTQPNAIRECERVQRERFARYGLDQDHARVGIVSITPWYIILNDAVLFAPSTKDGDPIPGTHLRILYPGESSGEQSVFILATDEQGHILLNRAYRHGIRAWTVESQGTVTRHGETHEQAVERCVREEIGRPILSVRPLSTPRARGHGVLPERGLIGAQVPAYFVTLGEPETEIADPTVRGHLHATPQQIAQWFVDGEICVNGVRHICACGFTAYAILLAWLRGLIKLPMPVR